MTATPNPTGFVIEPKLISFFDGRVDRDDGWGITSLKGEGKEKHLTKGAGGRDERCLDPDWCWWYTLRAKTAFIITK